MERRKFLKVVAGTGVALAPDVAPQAGKRARTSQLARAHPDEPTGNLACSRVRVEAKAPPPTRFELCRLRPAPGSLAPKASALWPAPPSSRSDGSSLGFLQLLCLVVGGERIDNVVEASLEDSVETVKGEIDAVIGDPRLVVIIGADLLASVA